MQFSYFLTTASEKWFQWECRRFGVLFLLPAGLSNPVKMDKRNQRCISLFLVSMCDCILESHWSNLCFLGFLLAILRTILAPRCFFILFCNFLKNFHNVFFKFVIRRSLGLEVHVEVGFLILERWLCARSALK